MLVLGGAAAHELGCLSRRAGVQQLSCTVEADPGERG